MMKITGLSHLFKWENLHNWWLTEYFFAPLYVYTYVGLLCALKLLLCLEETIVTTSLYIRHYNKIGLLYLSNYY